MKIVINVCFGGFGISDAAKQELHKRGSKLVETDKHETTGDLYYCGSDEDRADKDLIEVVEQLGKDANGQYADLKIVEIPDDIDWEIDEYDGTEQVEETHKTWS